MALDQIYLDTNKAAPFNPIRLKIREGDKGEVLPVQLSANFAVQDVRSTPKAFYAEKPDGKLIADKNTAHFTEASQTGFFNYHFPDEIYQSAGSITKAYFTVGYQESTSNFQISVLRKAGSAEESDNYITDAEVIIDNIKSQNKAAGDVLQDSRNKFSEIDKGWNDRKPKLDTAIDNANRAAKSADDAHTGLDKVKADTVKATSDAATQTTLAKTATDSANAAATNARNSANQADTAASIANTAATSAHNMAAETLEVRRRTEELLTSAPNNPAFKGVKGDKGDKGDQGVAGTGIALTGQLTSTANLPKTGVGGEAYQIDGRIWYWDVKQLKYVDGGPIVGPKGDKGDKGDTGIQGLKGDTGLIGPKGDKGDTGLMGPQGIKGDKGDTGIQGPKGDIGLTGPQGLKGDTGPLGPQGLKGDQGDKGDRTAVYYGDNILGNIIVEQTPRAVNIMDKGWAIASAKTYDFLIFVEDVVRAEYGVSIHRGDVYWATGIYEGKYQARRYMYSLNLLGPQGAKGDKGDRGDGLHIDGAAATVADLPKTPTDGQIYNVNGTLYIAKGGQWLSSGIVVGAKGDKGDKGDPGLQGVKGDTGPQGAKGETGIQGPKGDVGDTGPRGQKGDTGPTGPQGLKGDKGDKGDKAKTYIAARDTKITDLTDARAEISTTGTNLDSAVSGDLVIFADDMHVGDKTIHRGDIYVCWYVTLGIGYFGTTGANILGPKGDKGDKGDIGLKGDRGDGLHIDGVATSTADLPKNPADGLIYSVSGNLYFAKGGQWNPGGSIAGPKGDKGDTGATGLQGPKGDTGLTGPQGLKGDTGLQGPKGDTPSIEGFVKSATINGGTVVKADAAGNLALTVPTPDLSPYVRTTDLNARGYQSGDQVKAIMTTALSKLSWTGTQAQYDAMPADQKSQYLFIGIIKE
jgi:hypothetical protein